MSNAIVTGGSQSLGDIVAEQLARDKQREQESNESRKPVVNRWIPIYAAAPRPPVEWIGPHGETIAGVFFGEVKWRRKDGGEQLDSPALWRPVS